MLTQDQGLRTDGTSIFDCLRSDSEAWCLLGRHGRLGLHVPVDYVTRRTKYPTDFKNVNSTKTFGEAVENLGTLSLTRALLHISEDIRPSPYGTLPILLVGGVGSKDALIDLFRRRMSYERSTRAFANARFILPMASVKDADVELFKKFAFATVSSTTVEQLEADRKAALANRPKGEKKAEVEVLTSFYAGKFKGGERASLRDILEKPESVIIFAGNDFKAMWKTPELKSPLLKKVGETVGRTVTEDDLWFATPSANEIKAVEWGILAETGRAWYVDGLSGTKSKAFHEFKNTRKMDYEMAVFEGFKSLRSEFAWISLQPEWHSKIGSALLKRLGWLDEGDNLMDGRARTSIDLLEIGLRMNDPYSVALDRMNRALNEETSIYSFLRAIPYRIVTAADAEIEEFALGRLEEILRDKGCAKD